MANPEEKAHDAYLETVARLETDIAPVDMQAALTSIAISLKRIADVMEATNDWGEQGFGMIARSLTEALRKY